MQGADAVIGMKFGRLTVVSDAGRSGGGIIYLCKCDCGGEVVRPGRHLRYEAKVGVNSGCGCTKRDYSAASKANTKHGMSTSRLYRVFQNMKDRCLNPRCHAYKNYGGRGIGICSEWLNDREKFFEWAASSGYRRGLTIERIDNSGDYSPQNCRWATMVDQQRNKRTMRLISYGGLTMTPAQWGEKLGIKYETMATRVWLGWSDERIVTQPVRKFRAAAP